MTASVFPFVAPPARSGRAMLAPTGAVDLEHECKGDYCLSYRS